MLVTNYPLLMRSTKQMPGNRQTQIIGVRPSCEVTALTMSIEDGRIADNKLWVPLRMPTIKEGLAHRRA